MTKTNLNHLLQGLYRMRKLFFLAILPITPYISNSQILKERRIYYVDCSYSMKQNGIWNLVKDNLKEAIDNVSDETTELIICPYAFNSSSSVTFHLESATEKGKMILKKYIDHLPMNKNTKTYHEKPLIDFYNKRIAPQRINYFFLMTDGVSDHIVEDKNHDPFPDLLRQWHNKFQGKFVYGFYVMLNKKARGYREALKVIGTRENQRAHHLWAIESANVNINLIRLNPSAIINVKSEKFFDIPIYGTCHGIAIKASFPSNSNIKVKNTQIKNGKLRVFVTVKGDIHSLPEEQTLRATITMTGGGKFDFLVTDAITVKCLRKKERTLRINIR